MHPVGREHDPAPLLPTQFGRDPGRAEPRVAQGEGQHSLLHEGRGLVGHLRPPPFPRPQDLRAEPEHLATPPVVRRGVDPHGPTGRPDVAELLGEGECSQPEPVPGIIDGQGGPPFRSTARSSERMGRLRLQVWDVPRRRYNSEIGQPRPRTDGAAPSFEALLGPAVEPWRPRSPPAPTVGPPVKPPARARRRGTLPPGDDLGGASPVVIEGPGELTIPHGSVPIASEPLTSDTRRS